VGQEICSDAFAPGSIRSLPSFFSKFAEPLSEAVDALVGTDWYFSSCLHCEAIHCELSSPSHRELSDSTIKLGGWSRGNGNRIIYNRYFLPAPPHFCSRPAGSSPFIDIRSPLEMLRNAVGSRLSSSRGPDNTVPGCGQVRDRHGRPRLRHPVVSARTAAASAMPSLVASASSISTDHLRHFLRSEAVLVQGPGAAPSLPRGACRPPTLQSVDLLRGTHICRRAGCLGSPLRQLTNHPTGLQRRKLAGRGRPFAPPAASGRTSAWLPSAFTFYNP
jgi:hypothetical protein